MATNKAEMLKQYEISRDLFALDTEDIDGFARLFTIYETLVAEMKAKGSAVSKEDMQALKNRAKKNENAQAIARVAMSNINESATQAMAEDGDAIILIVEAMKELLSDLNFEAKEWMVNSSRTPEQRLAAKKDKQTKYNEASAIKNMIVGYWKMLRENFTLTDECFNADGSFPLKDSNDGLIPALSVLPNDPSKKEDEQKTTKKVDESALRFKWTPNEENAETQELPLGTSGADVAKMVCDKKKNVHQSWRSLRKLIAEQGKNLSTDEWELTFETGKLEGFIEAQNVAESEEENEENETV